MKTRLALALGLAMASVGLAACGGDDGSAMEGIYEVDTWTRNDTSCDSPGEDVLAQQFSTTFYVKEESFLGVTFLNLNFCDDVAECEMLAADADTIHLGMYGFDEGSDSSGWRSEYFAGFTNADNVCEGVYRVAEMTRDGDGGGVRVEIRDTESSGFAPDADGFCEDEPGKVAAEGQPCVQLEVFAASRVGEI